MLTHERNKNSRTKRGCLVCFQLGTTGKSFSYFMLSFMPMYAGKEIKPVIKEIGLCHKHTKEFCDTTKGSWKKSPYGKLPIRDEVYELRTEFKESRRPSSPNQNQPEEKDRYAQLVKADGTFSDGPTLVKAPITGDVPEAKTYRNAALGDHFFKRVPTWW